MSGEIEAAGAMANAGLIAGALEGRDPTEAGEGPCLNCGAQLTGRFCSACGQASHAHRSLVHLVEELLHGVFNFDTKVWRTLPMVLVRPGTLTRNYVYGKRARYVSPLALFLLSVFLLFFVISLLPEPTNVVRNDNAREAAQEQLEAARDGLKEAQDGLAELRQQRGTAAPSVHQRTAEAAVEHAVALAQAEVARREAALARVTAEEQAAREAAARAPVQVNVGPNAPPAAPALSPPSPPAAPASTTTTAATAPATPEEAPHASVGNVDLDEGDTLNDALRKIGEENLEVDGRPILNQHMQHKLQNPELFIRDLQEATSKFSFLLVPISLPFIAFLFMFKRGITLYDHTVFALYSLSFASLLFVLILATSPVQWLQWVPGTAILIGFPIHMFFQLKGAYALGWWSALWRTFFLLIFCMVCLVVFLLLILYIGLAG